jgi:hypothetical protein
MQYLEQYNTLVDYQHGFRHNRSCESQLVTTIEDITKHLDVTYGAMLVAQSFSTLFGILSGPFAFLGLTLFSSLFTPSSNISKWLMSSEVGSVPDYWIMVVITTLFRKGDKSLPVNYRPISLTSVTCKLMEHIMQHLEKYSILVDYQQGFRQNRSRESQLVTTMLILCSGYCLDHLPFLDWHCSVACLLLLRIFLNGWCQVMD